VFIQASIVESIGGFAL